jgi:hypothetical protein
MSSTAEKAHAESNGVLRVGRRGRGLKKFAFSDDGPGVEIDVIEVYDEWCDVDEDMRDDASKIKISMNEYGRKRQEFVQGLVSNAYAKTGQEKVVPVITRAEAEDFIRMIFTEVKVLRNFTSEKTANDSSSPGSSGPETELRFSQ